MKRVVFCDIDGTLLNNKHRMLESTKKAIMTLKNKGIPFVIVTARGPSGVYPILERYKFTCPIVCYSGALILNENREVLYENGLSKDLAKEIIEFLENENLDCTWNVYSKDYWIVNNRSDERVAREEAIVEAESIEGNVDLLPNGEEVGKLLCMCNPDKTDVIEQKLKMKFPQLSIVKSSEILLEVMNKGISKGKSIEFLCDKWDINKENTVAFGDHYNDVEMLQTVGTPFLMENAPAELKEIITSITSSNEADGIYNGLKQIGLID